MAKFQTVKFEMVHPIRKKKKEKKWHSGEMGTNAKGQMLNGEQRIVKIRKKIFKQNTKKKKEIH